MLRVVSRQLGKLLSSGIVDLSVLLGKGDLLLLMCNKHQNNTYTMVTCEIRITAPPRPILQSTSECHLMSQRGNSCRYPEVTIQLNHYFYFIFATETRTKPKGPVATLGSIMWSDVASHRPWSHTELLSPQPALVLGCCRSVWCESPHSPVHSTGGLYWLCPGGLRDLSPTAWVSRAVVLHCFQVLFLCSCRWTGIWALTCTCTASGNATQVDQSRAHSDSIELRQYPLHTELEFKS